MVFGMNAQPHYDYARLKREKLGRGVVAVRKDAQTNWISWRYLSSDPENTQFNVYRNKHRINAKPIGNATCLEDRFSSTEACVYEVKPVFNGVERPGQAFTLPAHAPVGYINIPLDVPEGGVAPDGRAYTYSPNDASVGDVDGDGEYEIILKWEPSNAHDNAHDGYTGNVLIDCYTLKGEKRWRIDLGRNIRAGAHYTQFMVYDLDGDGKAEIVMKTADGTVDGLGNVIGDPEADYREPGNPAQPRGGDFPAGDPRRNSSPSSPLQNQGRILSGPEYLTVFDGQTGRAMQTIDYNPPRGDWQDWGDSRGNRSDRYLACIAYLDGEYPSVVMCRGYYTRAVLAAYDWRNGQLTERWVFDTKTPGNEKYKGQGNHNLRVGDVDGDGCDEIIYGSCAIDHDGKGLYSTGMGHGDAFHLTVFDPTRKGMQVWDCHENRRDGSTFRDAATGEVLFQLPSDQDVGRCLAADIDPYNPGLEMWSSDSRGILNVKGEHVLPNLRGVPVNMACWWDGDLLRELLDKNRITKYDYTDGRLKTLLTAEGCMSNNGTKATPCIQGDIIGDWREEVLFRTADNQNLRLYVSTFYTNYRFHSFAEEPVYRISMATQNVAYNQPTQPGFYFGADLGKCFPEKEITSNKDRITLDAGMDYDSYRWSVGGNKRSREITAKDIPVGKRTKIELAATFRGYTFTDSVFVTFNPSGLNARDFERYWTVESESPSYHVSFEGDTAEIIAPKGLTLWRKEKMAGTITIEYDACVMDEGQTGDRLSDLNCFWMASDPEHPDDLWKRKKERNGVFVNYYALQMYYVGYGGNHNTTTRFRRYDGDRRGITEEAARPAVLREYTDPENLLEPNRWYRIRISNEGNKVTYTIDGKRLVDFRDADPLTSGWFGFRTTASRTRITNFKYACTDENEKPVTLGWLGKMPDTNSPVSFGVPFAQGAYNPGNAAKITGDNGTPIPADAWPLAYWPDGSVKWGGFAAVIPANTEKVSLEIGKKSAGAQQPAITVTQKGNDIMVNTGVITAFISGRDGALIDSLLYGNVKTGGKVYPVCTTQSEPFLKNTGQLVFTHHASVIKRVELERAGGIRTLVRLDGAHRSSDGREWLPFTVRLYFYAGSDQIRMVHTFIYDGDQDSDFISGLGIGVDVPLREALYNRHVAFSCGGGVWSEPVQPLSGRTPLVLNDDRSLQQQQMEGKRIPSYEAFDEKGRFLLDQWASWDGYRLSQLSADAFSVRKRTAADRPWIGTYSGARADGYAFVGDVSGGLGLCLHDFWQSYPSSLEVENARSPQASLTAWLWSPEAEAMDLRHYDHVAHDLMASYEDVQEGLSTPYGIARTHTLTLIPQPAYPGKGKVAAMSERLNGASPLVCTPEYLHRQRAFGVWSLPDRSTSFRAAIEDRLEAYIDFYQKATEQHKWYGFWNYGDVMHAYDPVRHSWKYDVGGFAWDNTELASNSWLWYSFLRTGRFDIWKMAEAMTRHTTEVDVYHCGENAGLGSRHNVSHWGCGAKEARISQAVWNRFYYYLTTDERCGDLMSEVKDSEQKLYTMDPMRLAQPREEHPCTAPARLRIGPDWLAYAGNWMTEWERTRNTAYRDKIIAGMKSIAALPNGLFSGPKALGFDPATGIISSEGDPTLQNTNHLMTIMGGFELMNEMQEMIQLPEWHRIWLEHARLYKKKSREINGSVFRISRLQAYAAYYERQPAWGKEAWDDLLRSGRNLRIRPFTTVRIHPPEVPASLDENPFVSTNDAAAWSLDAIYMLETVPYDE